MIAKTKICSKCGKAKKFTEFSRHKTCKNGRRTNCKCCCKKYYVENKDYYKTHYEARKEEYKKAGRSYYRENKEEIKEYSRSYYRANKPKIFLRIKRWIEKNKGYRKLYYEARKEEYKKAGRSYYRANKEEISLKAKQYYKTNKEEILLKQNRHSGTLTDSYVRGLLQLPAYINVPSELLEAKRLHLKLKRLLRRECVRWGKHY